MGLTICLGEIETALVVDDQHVGVQSRLQGTFSSARRVQWARELFGGRKDRIVARRAQAHGARIRRLQEVISVGAWTEHDYPGACRGVLEQASELTQLEWA